MNSFFQWDIFLQDTGAGETYFHWLMSAWGWTLSVAFLALIMALILGFLIGVLRTLPQRFWARAGDVWTEVFRNIPILVQIFIWYHVIPSLFLPLREIPSFLLVVIGLGLFTSARVSEQVKAGIDSIARGQLQAALALGLSRVQAYRLILLPQTLRIIIPPLTSEAMNIIKNSSVAFAVSISELTMFALQAGEETSRNIEMFAATTFLYFISALAVNQLAVLLEKRLQIPGSFGAAR